MTLIETTWEYWQKLCREWKGVRRDSSEKRVHDLRVASRRVFSCLSLLETILDRPFKARRCIKKLMKKLGPLRDVQVQISIVEKWTRTRTVTKFLKSLERAKDKESRRALDYLTPQKRRKIRRALGALERGSLERLKSMPPGTMRSRIEAALKRQRDALKKAQSGTTPPDPRSLHRIRVAARKLRYSLEAISESGATPTLELQRLRRQSTKLGRQHDRQLLDEKFENWRIREGSVRAAP